MEILRHNSPRQLSFRLDVYDGLRALDGLFPVEAADKLTHLLVVFYFRVERRVGEDYNTDNNVPWGQFIVRNSPLQFQVASELTNMPFQDTLIDSMKHLHLTHLRIVFMYEVRRENDESIRTPLDDEDESVYVVNEEVLHPIASRFCNAMPTLRYVLLTTSGYTSLLNGWQIFKQVSKRFSSKAWRAPGGDTGLSSSDIERRPCVEIGSDEAEAIIDREELHLGSREQVSDIGVFAQVIETDMFYVGHVTVLL